MPQDPSEVTRADVQELWSQALADENVREAVRQRAETLLDRTNAENPPVNWGLTRLHAALVTGLDPDQLSEAHAAWHGDLRAFDADPAAWTTDYFVSMLNDFRTRHGTARARAFGRKMVAQGLVANDDVVIALGKD